MVLNFVLKKANANVVNRLLFFFPLQFISMYLIFLIESHEVMGIKLIFSENKDN